MPHGPLSSHGNITFIIVLPVTQACHKFFCPPFHCHFYFSNAMQSYMLQCYSESWQPWALKSTKDIGRRAEIKICMNQLPWSILVQIIWFSHPKGVHVVHYSSPRINIFAKSCAHIIANIICNLSICLPTCQTKIDSIISGTIQRGGHHFFLKPVEWSNFWRMTPTK